MLCTQNPIPYQHYIAGADADAISPLAYVLHQATALECSVLERELRRFNPPVYVDENDPEAVHLLPEYEDTLLSLCGVTSAWSLTLACLT
jgi:hypothetical protein